ncbi:MAG: DUF2304 domain-containing protein [Alphaproteobacteria bacterium]|nr:DUF2304 domain-containing protein [Alphaproteobacteria bacterium]MBM4437046.1 DUF2304 domain-containing protein [Actinomycetota bacterium]
MSHHLIVLTLALLLAVLVRARLMQIDLSFPWFVALAVLAFASTNPAFVNWLGGAFGILYPPLAVVFLVFFLLLGIIVSMAIMLSLLRERVLAMVKQDALLALSDQERRLALANTQGRSLADGPY